jgi:transcriptional regulator with XRE-family HTH domain
MDSEPGDGGAFAANRARQRELYGMALGERVRRITGALGTTQAKLARALGLSPAMLSQLVSARRVKIGDPTVLARLLLLDQRCTNAVAATGVVPLPPKVAEELIAVAAEARWEWPAGQGPPRPPWARRSRSSPRCCGRRPRARPDGAPVPGCDEHLRCGRNGWAAAHW